LPVGQGAGIIGVVSMLQWPRNRREFWTFVRRLLALLVLAAACGAGFWAYEHVVMSQLV